MSVLDRGKIDGIGLNKEGDSVVLMISDHLDWSDEYEHLVSLQDKINDYLGFVESGQVNEVYSKVNVNGYTIIIYFKHNPTQKCREFINSVSQMLSVNGVSLEYEISSDAT